MPFTLAATQVTKRYGGVVALAEGTLTVSAGEVVALVGANGSGKSTLSKIITGVVAPDGGELVVDGQAVSFRSPHAARDLGITAVYQELSLIPDMTIAENIWLAHEPLRARTLVNGRSVKARTQELLDLFAGAIPLPGVQIPISLFFAWLMRGNVAVSLLSQAISNPLTAVPLAIAEYQIRDKVAEELAA